MWPAVRKRAEDVIASTKANYVVVEAALLLEAEWDNTGLVHQVWSCIVPPEESIKRAVERDNLSKEEVCFFSIL